MENLKYNESRGFTLVEVMVAVAILAVSIAVAISIVPSGLNAARHARNQITASYLAQEGMEMVRNNRDNGMIFESPGFPGVSTRWLEHVDDAGNGGRSIFDCLNVKCGTNAFLPPGYGVTLYSCPLSGCDKLRYIDTPSGGRIYGYGSPFDSSPVSIFTRTVEITEIPHNFPSSGGPVLINASGLSEDNPDHSEIAVTVTVTWSDGGGSSKSIVVRENMFNWWH